MRGYPEALQKKERIVVPKAEVSDEYAEMLDCKLRKVQKGDVITIIYFSEGQYLKTTGMVSRIDETARLLKIVNTKIRFEDLYDILEG